MINNTDEDLFNKVKSKNKRAFKLIFLRYESALYNFILKYCGNAQLAQDLLQDTFTKTWFSAQQFDASKGSLKNWLYTIALNTTRNEMTKKRYQVKHVDIDDSIQIETMNQDDKIDELFFLMKSLAQPLKEVLLLKHFQELTFKEVAVILGEPESTIKSRFQKATKEIRTAAAVLEAK